MARRARKRRAGAAPSRPPKPSAATGGRNGPATTGGRNGSATTGGRNGSATTGGRNGSATTGGRNGSATTGEPGAASGGAMARGYARSRERDEAARAALVPLAPGERPWPIAVSAVLAGLFAVLNLVLILAGWEVDGERPVAGGLVFVAVMVAAAVGMWRLKYWAVLGFEVLLGVTFIGALLSLLRAGDAWGALLAVLVIGVTGPLFYLLIRQMARIQMPKRRPDA